MAMPSSSGVGLFSLSTGEVWRGDFEGDDAVTLRAGVGADLMGMLRVKEGAARFAGGGGEPAGVVERVRLPSEEAVVEDIAMSSR